MYSAAQYTGDGSTTDFVVPFPYIDKTHILVSVASVPVAFTWPGSSTVRITPAPANGETVMIQRNSSRAARIIDFVDSAAITEKDLDKSTTQLLYVAQEAFDQVNTQSYFSNDANGARVVNMADPLVATDGATKGWTQAYITSLGLGVSGSDLLPTNNTWTGTNLFNNTVSVKGAVFNGTNVAAQDLLDLSKGLRISLDTNQAAANGYGFVIEAQRSTGALLLYGQQISAYAKASWAGSAFGTTIGGWRAQGSAGTTAGAVIAAVNTNPSDSTSPRYGLDVQFLNREPGASQGGASSFFGQAGLGTGSNFYNANSWAIQISAQGRSESGATFVGWNRAMRVLENALDVAKAQAWSNAVQYSAGDYVSNGGHVWLCLITHTNQVPPNITYWADYGPSTTVGAVGIDFAGVGPTTAGRMLGAIRLRGQMPILWDSEGYCVTKYDPTGQGLWTLANAFSDRSLTPTERFGINITTGDIRVNGVVRYLGTRSRFSAHRNGTLFIKGGSGWSQLTCPNEEYDDRGEYNTGSSTFTPNTPGDYLVTVQFETENSCPAGAFINIAIYKNGVAYKARSITTLAGINSLCVSCPVSMNGTTDNVSMWAYWDGAGGVGAINITGLTTATFFMASKIQ